jgi:hypothetical protein
MKFCNSKLKYHSSKSSFAQEELLVGLFFPILQKNRKSKSYSHIENIIYLVDNKRIKILHFHLGFTPLKEVTFEFKSKAP